MKGLETICLEAAIQRERERERDMHTTFILFVQAVLGWTYMSKPQGLTLQDRFARLMSDVNAAWLH